MKTILMILTVFAATIHTKALIELSSKSLKERIKNPKIPLFVMFFNPSD